MTPTIKTTFALLTIATLSCDSNDSAISDPATAFANPPAEPELFLPNVIQGPFDIRDIAMSNDGREIYYTVSTDRISAIVYLEAAENGWVGPRVAPFSGQYSDLEPALSPDNTKLFFASNRPDSIGGEPDDFDIWMVTRTEAGWSSPINLGEPVNTDQNEFFPSVAASGNLYFTAQYVNSRGREDIYISEYVNDTYQAPYPLSDSVNSTTWEFNAYVSPDESMLVFTSYGREDDLGRGDLYVSRRVSGAWRPAYHLGPTINTSSLDYCPFVTSDGVAFFFTSDSSSTRSHYDQPLDYQDLMNIMSSNLNGSGNIYWVSAEALDPPSGG